ncbi:MAG: hypothetical protein EX285_01510 [Thaumarchaeota archaeon]|nr:hypothetical protein [Nitrososphaerota archaeon]
MSNKLGEIGSTKELKTIAVKELKLDYEKMVMPIEAVYTIADHTRTLLFAISDGALPSNVGGGYNLRVILRRALATLHRLGWNIKLEDVADMLIDYLKTIYPELEEHRDEIKTILRIETNRYHESTERMKRIANNLVKGKKQPSNEELIKLYESDGITPDFLKEQCVISNIPPNFYAELAVLHNEQALQKALKPITGIDSVESTKLLFYEDQNITDFEAKIVKIIGKYIVLDKTAFYARGGGQEPDHGMIANTAVNDVVKQGNVVLHEIMNETLKEGSIVKCAIDPIRRGLIMRHHTATHVLNSAARNALGSWVWQHSAFKDHDSARLDITHHSSLTRDDIMKIEKFANKAIQENLPVIIKTLDRNQAEQLYGFRIYQGGYVPNSKIRIVNIEGWDIEACAGTHVARTGEIGMLKIIKAERIQDGVVRLEFVAGQAALEYIQKQEEQLNEIVRTLGSSKEKLIESFQNTMKDTDETRKKLKATVKKFAPLIVNDVIQKTKHIGKIKLFTVYEKELDEEYHITIGEQAIDIEPSLIYCSLIAKEQGIRVIVFVGEEARNNGIKAGVIAKQIANTVDGSGGGDDRFGQGGGKSVERINNVLLKIEEFVRK